MRARELGIIIGDGTPGAHNAITDVPGVRVGHATIVEGEGPLVEGRGPIRTGVTVLVPHDGSPWEEPVFAGWHALNGNGELTGLHWVAEYGMLKSLIGLTNSHSVGVVRDALVTVETRQRAPGRLFWSLPVVGETWDGVLNDVNGRHVTAQHVEAALAAAVGGPVAEGNVGGGTGMICHGFKGGIGTASREVALGDERFVLGVLVQANQGRRERLTIGGRPVGQVVTDAVVPIPVAPEDTSAPGGGGSIIVIIATNAPLLSDQCRRLAQRASLGVARIGGTGEQWSGDLMLAFATGNRGLPPSDYGAPAPLATKLRMLCNTHMDALIDAAVESTEEAIVNALLAAETMTGRDGITAYHLDEELLVKAVRNRG